MIVSASRRFSSATQCSDPVILNQVVPISPCYEVLLAGMLSVSKKGREEPAKGRKEPAPVEPVTVTKVEVYFITAEKSGKARAKGVGEKEKECTTECKSQRRLDEKAPWALHYGSGEGEGDEKGTRRGGEKRDMHV